MKKHPRILFFTKGAVPTGKERAAAAKLGTNVFFRNACMVQPGDSVEVCDGVAGEVPASYKAMLPSADDALAQWQREIDALTAAAVEPEPAPAPAPASEPTTPAATEPPASAPASTVGGWGGA